MRNGKTVFVIFSLIFFFLVGSSSGADVAKIGVVDFQRIITTSDSGKIAQQKISQKGKKMEADLKEKGNEIKELKEKLERESVVMSKEKREDKEREFRIKINDIKTLEKKYMAELKMIEKKLVTDIQNNVLEIVEEIGKKEGYLLIINKLGVVYSPGSIDITDMIIQQYNTKVAQKKE